MLGVVWEGITGKRTCSQDLKEEKAEPGAYWGGERGEQWVQSPEAGGRSVGWRNCKEQGT